MISHHKMSNVEDKCLIKHIYQRKKIVYYRSSSVVISYKAMCYTLVSDLASF